MSLFRILGKGVIVILPFALVTWLLYFLFDVLHSLWGIISSLAALVLNLANDEGIRHFPSAIVSTILVLIMLVIIFYVGYRFEKNQKAIFIKVGEWLISKIPLIGSIYHTIKDLISMISGSSRDKYLGVAFVSFGEGELLGFITQEEGEYFWVFCPLSPPTSGLLFRIHKDRLKRAKMSVSEGLRKVVSLGMK